MTTLGVASQTYTVSLHPQHASHEHGTATLTQEGADLIVSIAVRDMPGSGAPEFAHIHHGRCGDLGSATSYDLQPIRDGRSKTKLKNVSLATFAAAPYSIAIHQTLAHVSHHIACGGPIGAK